MGGCAPKPKNPNPAAVRMMPAIPGSVSAELKLTSSARMRSTLNKSAITAKIPDNL